MSGGTGAATVVVTVGTDHHPFDRLSGWVERWAGAHPHVRVVHQHGSSRPARGSEAVALVPREELLERQRAADLVVAQGGPGSIMDARLCGRVPVVVPRLAALGEVVDDHQVDFARRLAARGWVRLVEDEASLHAALDEGIASPALFRCPPHEAPVSQTAAALARVLVEVRGRRPGFVARHRLRALVPGAGQRRTQ